MSRKGVWVGSADVVEVVESIVVKVVEGAEGMGVDEEEGEQVE
jgi:hypothetical protein